MSSPNTPAWLTEAYKHIGVKEIPGVNNNPLIVRMWQVIKRGGIKSDSVPWCAAFVGFCLENVGIKSSRFESAKSYLTWGVPIEKPIPGCIVIFGRDGGGHVGFVVGRDHLGNLGVLGGNQSDAVNIRTFPADRVLGYRWPEAWAIAAMPMPTIEAAKSVTEA